MAEIVINIPNVKPHDRIEVEARINGERAVYHYRVEVFAWEDCEEKYTARADCLRDMIGSYDKGWRLQQIGQATDKSVQVLFRESRVNRA
jgi:hypothetical protein